ncbi:hypothetical protein J3F83DRAFT_642615 [Trichoderma novae-zelandiae]
MECMKLEKTARSYGRHRQQYTIILYSRQASPFRGKPPYTVRRWDGIIITLHITANINSRLQVRSSASHQNQPNELTSRMPHSCHIKQNPRRLDATIAVTRHVSASQQGDLISDMCGSSALLREESTARCRTINHSFLPCMQLVRWHRRGQKPKTRLSRRCENPTTKHQHQHQHQHRDVGIPWFSSTSSADGLGKKGWNMGPPNPPATTLKPSCDSE